MSVRRTLNGMDTPETPMGWCPYCGWMVYASDEEGDECADCHTRLIPPRRMSPRQRSMHAFNEWMARVKREDKWGPSPGGAAGELGCSRAMIDKLVSAGILERSEYNRDGHFVVMISGRSIDLAKGNKAKYGQWKPRDDWHDLAEGTAGRQRKGKSE